MAETRQMSMIDKLTRTTPSEQNGASEGTTSDATPHAPRAMKAGHQGTILPGQQLRVLQLDLVSPAPEGQIRKEFDEERLRTLADSLKRSGVREPIIVTPHGAAPGRFQIVAGERRWRAARIAGLTEIPCIVDPTLADRRHKLLAQAEENVHRANLNPVEEAAALAQLMESRGIDVREAGALLGRSYIQARRLHRLHLAVDPIKQAVVRGDLDARAAVEVVRIYNKLAKTDMSVDLRDTVTQIEALIQRIVREEWSARRVEQYATKLGAGASEEDGEVGSPVPASQPARAEKAGAARAVRGAPALEAPVTQAAAPAPVLTRSDERVVIEAKRIFRGGLSPEEREELIAVLEELLMRARRS